MKILLLFLSIALSGCQSYTQTYSVSYEDETGKTYGAGITLAPAKGFKK